MAWGMVSINTSIFSMQARGLPGRLIISVLPRITEAAREIIACMVILRDSARIASAMPGTFLSAIASVASGDR